VAPECRSHYDLGVSAHKAVVRNGRLILDEPTDLPEGQVVELLDADPYSDELDLDGEQRARLDDAIDRGRADAKAGRTTSAKDFIDELDGR
jgi:hypothetical protein